MTRTAKMLAAQKATVATYLQGYFTGEEAAALVSRPSYSPMPKHRGGVNDRMAEAVSGKVSKAMQRGGYHLVLHGWTAFRECSPEEQEAARHIHGLGLPAWWLARACEVQPRTIEERAERCLTKMAERLWNDNGGPAAFPATPPKIEQGSEGEAE